MFINYKKLAKEIMLQSKEEIIKEVARNVADVIVSDKDKVRGIMDGLYVFEYNPNGYGDRHKKTLENHIGEYVASKLTDEVYEMKRAEILSEFKKENLLELMSNKLNNQAKKAVENFIKGDKNEY